MTSPTLPCRGTVIIRELKKTRFVKCIVNKIGKQTTIISIDGVNHRVPTSDVEIDDGETYNGVKR